MTDRSALRMTRRPIRSKPGVDNRLERRYRLKIHVDTTKCLGNGFCEAIAEDVFDLGDKTVVRVAVDPVPEARRTQMREAVQTCPVGALRIQD